MPTIALEPVVVETVIIRCKRPGCKREAVARGLCRSDYAEAHRLVRLQVTDWDDLERRGKVDPKRPTAKAWLLA